MECPNCGAKEKVLVKVCQSCNEAFASEDLLELYQLTFLVDETENWRGVHEERALYVSRLDILRSRLLRFKQKESSPVEKVVVQAVPPAEHPVAKQPALEELVPQPVVYNIPDDNPVKSPAKVEAKPATTSKPVQPPKEAVPFDQWLLSERNIKFALYSGGILLVLAGLIFIGVNWGRIPGPVKFAITLSITGLMYLGGYLMFQRPLLKIGGVALLGVSSGFMALNFAVLQIYVLGPNGLRDDVMWLIASPICMLLYALTAYWTKSELFTTVALAALASTVTAALVVFGAPFLVYILIYALLAFVVFGLARFFDGTNQKNYTHRILLIASHGAMPLIIAAALMGWIFNTGCSNCTQGSPWVAVTALIVGMLFYIVNVILYNWQLMRWAAMLLFPLNFGVILFELNIPPAFISISLVGLALVYLTVGYLLHRRTKEQSIVRVLPFLLISYGLAGIASFWAVGIFLSRELLNYRGTDVLYIVLYLDVILLMLTNMFFKHLFFRWSAALLFPVPFIMTLTKLNFSGNAMMITMMALALGYLTVGYLLYRQTKEQSSALPFLVISYGLAGIASFWAMGPFVSREFFNYRGTDVLYIVLYLDVVLLLLTNFLFKNLAPRWAAALLFPVPFSMTLIKLNFNGNATMITMMALALVYLGVGYALEKGKKSRPEARPVYFASFCIAAVVSVLALILFVSKNIGLYDGKEIFHIVLYMDVGLLVLAELIFRRIVIRWGAAFLFPFPFTLTLTRLNFSDTAVAVTLMVLALVYLGLGYTLEKLQKKRSSGWPLYVSAYAIAVFVTLMAVSDTASLVKVLLGDVILLALSAAVHRDYRWVYGAAWLLMLPIYLWIGLFVPLFHIQGLLMGLLGLIYLIIGYILGRRKLYLGGPFLTAAVLLSITVPVLTWGSPVFTTLALIVIAGGYLFAALWQKWNYLLYPALIAVNIAVFNFDRIFFGTQLTLNYAGIISAGIFGSLVALGGLALRRSNLADWAVPFYAMAVGNLAGSYLIGLSYGGWLVVGLSVAYSILMLSFAWWERKFFSERNLPPVLSYIGLGLIFVWQIFLVDSLGSWIAFKIWPGTAAGLCVIFVCLSWGFRKEPVSLIFGKPLWYSSLILMIFPMAIAVTVFDYVICMVTFGLASFVYLLDGFRRRNLGSIYFGVATSVVTIWAALLSFNVTEPQAFIIPACLALLGVGWHERTLGRISVCLKLTLLGLVVLMASAFIQSLPIGAHRYAVLLGVECLAALGWGIRNHSRGYVQVGGLALLANALTQFGPAFVELDRWIQLGVIGSILMGAGMVALFRRESILEKRRQLADEWRQWEA